MKSITIHGIDGPLAEPIKSKADAEGLSMNKTIKGILEESLGVVPKGNSGLRGDFEEFCGIWSGSDVEEFENGPEAFRRIDAEGWQ